MKFYYFINNQYNFILYKLLYPTLPHPTLPHDSIVWYYSIYLFSHAIQIAWERRCFLFVHGDMEVELDKLKNRAPVKKSELYFEKTLNTIYAKN